MRRHPSILGLSLVAPAGILLGHTLGYSVADSGHSHGADVAHGYLSPALLASTVLVVAGLLLAAGESGRRRLHRRRVSWAAVASVQGVAFLVMEAAERIVAHQGLGAVLGSTAVLAGLVAQLALAAVAIAVLRASTAMGGRLAQLLTRPVTIAVRNASLARIRPDQWHRPGGPLALVAAPRGPPAF